MKYLINQIVIALHNWEASGCTDSYFEQQMDLHFDRLKKAAGTDTDGAIKLIQQSLGGEQLVS